MRTTTPRACAAWAVVCCLPMVAAHAVDVDTLDVQRDGSRYRVTMDVRLDAEADAAYRIFADPANLPRINPAVRHAEVLAGAATGSTRLLTEVHVCFSFFCRTLRQVQDMRQQPQSPGGWLYADVLPDRSDLRFGQARWHLQACETPARTCLRFEATLEPRFWVPLLIGPFLMQRKLRQEAVQTSEGIERLARS